MTLSSAWAEPITVEVEGEDRLHHKQQQGSRSRAGGSSGPFIRRDATNVPATSTVGRYAAAGQPITIRPRAEMPPASQPCPTLPPTNSSSSATASHRHGGRDPPPPSSSSSSALTLLANSRGAVRRLVTTGTMVPKTNIHDTFWRPDPNGGEVGLLEFIHRRGPNSRNHVLLQNRPLEELQRNFSPASNSGWNIDLSHNAFRLPKTALAVAQMQEAFGRGAGGSRSSQETIRVRPDDIQAAVVQNLETIQQEEYYLVRYRDYSPWAVEHYPDLVQQQSSWQAYMAGGGSGRYVEQCFAVHVGQSPGELIPLTESQLLFGVDILQRQLVQEMARLAPPSVSSHSSAPGMPSYAWGHSMNHLQNQHDVDFRALNEDQFNSLWGVLGEGFVKLGLEGDEVRRREEKARQEKEKHFREFVESGGGGDGMDGFYKPPAWYDWRPSAIQKRVRYRLNRAYRTVGQLAVQACVVGLAMFLLYRAIPGVPTLVSTLTAGVIGPRDGSAASHYHGRGATSSSGYQLKDRGLIASVLLGPKDLMDYLLAPADA